MACAVFPFEKVAMVISFRFARSTPATPPQPAQPAATGPVGSAPASAPAQTAPAATASPRSQLKYIGAPARAMLAGARRLRPNGVSVTGLVNILAGERSAQGGMPISSSRAGARRKPAAERDATYQAEITQGGVNQGGRHARGAVRVAMQQLFRKDTGAAAIPLPMPGDLFASAPAAPSEPSEGEAIEGEPSYPDVATLLSSDAQFDLEAARLFAGPGGAPETMAPDQALLRQLLDALKRSRSGEADRLSGPLERPTMLLDALAASTGGDLRQAIEVLSVLGDGLDITNAPPEPAPPSATADPATPAAAATHGDPAIPAAAAPGEPATPPAAGQEAGVQRAWHTARLLARAGGPGFEALLTLSPVPAGSPAERERREQSLRMFLECGDRDAPPEMARLASQAAVKLWREPALARAGLTRLEKSAHFNWRQHLRQPGTEGDLSKAQQRTHKSLIWLLRAEDRGGRQHHWTLNPSRYIAQDKTPFAAMRDGTLGAHLDSDQKESLKFDLPMGEAIAALRDAVRGQLAGLPDGDSAMRGALMLAKLNDWQRQRDRGLAPEACRFDSGQAGNIVMDALALLRANGKLGAERRLSGAAERERRAVGKEACSFETLQRWGREAQLTTGGAGGPFHEKIDAALQARAARPAGLSGLLQRVQNGGAARIAAQQPLADAVDALHDALDGGLAEVEAGHPAVQRALLHAKLGEWKRQRALGRAPQDCRFGPEEAGAVVRRAMAALRMADQDAGALLLASALPRHQKAIQKEMCGVDTLQRWGREARLEVDGAGGPFRDKIEAAQAALDTLVMKPEDLSVESLRVYLKKYMRVVPMGNRVRHFDGATMGLNNTGLPYPTSPDVRVRKSTMAGAEINTSGHAHEIAFYKQQVYQEHLGAQHTFGMKLAQLIQLGTTEGGNAGAELAIVQGVRYRFLRRLDADQVGTTEHKVMAEQFIDHFCDAALALKKQPRGATEVWDSMIVDNYFDSPDFSVSWQDHRQQSSKVQLYSVNGVSLQAGGAESDGDAANAGAAHTRTGGAYIGASATVGYEYNPTIGLNRSENTGSLQRTVVQMGAGGRGVARAGVGVSPPGATRLNVAQVATTFGGHGKVAAARVIEENGRIRHGDTYQDVEYETFQAYDEGMRANLGIWQRLMGEGDFEAHMRETKNNFQPNQRPAERWRIREDAARLFDALRSRVVLRDAAIDAATDPDRRAHMQAERDRMVAEGAALFNDFKRWWEPVGSWNLELSNTTHSLLGLNYWAQLGPATSTSSDHEDRWQGASTKTMNQGSNAFGGRPKAAAQAADPA